MGIIYEKQVQSAALREKQLRLIAISNQQTNHFVLAP